jgi:hypothetical protein
MMTNYRMLLRAALTIGKPQWKATSAVLTKWRRGVRQAHRPTRRQAA